MMQGVSQPLRRALALTILIAAVAMGWGLIVQPLLDLTNARRGEIEALSTELGRLQAIVARKPELERRSSSAQIALDAEGGLWTGLSPAEIAAAMQDRLRQVVGNSGRLRSATVVSETGDHGFLRIRLRISVEGTLETVQATLGSIESEKPAMFVDSLGIHSVDAGGADHPPALTMEIDVSGYMRMPTT